jgi:hypothetical protein
MELDMKDNILPMSLDYRKLVDHYSGLVAAGVNLTPKQFRHYDECRRFAKPEPFDIGAYIDAHGDEE